MTDALPLSARNAILASPNAVSFESMPPRMRRALQPVPSFTRNHPPTNFDKLPTEIIAHIFQGVHKCRCTNNYPNWWGQELKKDHHFGWLVVTQVCSRWRKIALESSALWTCHPCLRMPLAMAEAFIVRSKALPLTLCFRGSPTSSFQNMTPWLTTSVLSRVRAIDLRSCDATGGTIKTMLSQNLPQLEELSIFDAHRYKQPDVGRGWRLCDRAPKLKRLTWLCQSPPVQSPVYSASITHLTLGAPASSSKFISWRLTWKFAALLRCVPNLEELNFYNFLPFDTSSPQMILLPASLRYLNIYATNLAAAKCKLYARFWTHLEAAPATVFTMQYAPDKLHAFDGLIADGVDMLSHITAGFSSECSAWELDISSHVIGALYEERPRSSWTRGWERRGCAYGSTSLGDWPLQLAPGGRYLRGPGDILRTLDQFPLHSLRAISFSSGAFQFWRTNGGWPGIFAEARAVRRIAFPLYYCLLLLRALASYEAYRGLIFPFLETIVVMPMFEGGNTRAFNEFDVSSAFLEVVRKRARLGAPIREMLVTKVLENELGQLWILLRANGVEIIFF